MLNRSRLTFRATLEEIYSFYIVVIDFLKRRKRITFVHVQEELTGAPLSLPLGKVLKANEWTCYVGGRRGIQPRELNGLGIKLA